MERGQQNWLPHHLEAVGAALGVLPRDLLPGGPDGATDVGTESVSNTQQEGHALRALAAHHARELRRLAEDLERLAGEEAG